MSEEVWQSLKSLIQHIGQTLAELSVSNPGHVSEVTYDVPGRRIDQRIEEIIRNPAGQVDAYDVELEGETQQVETCSETVKLVNEYYADKEYCPVLENP